MSKLLAIPILAFIAALAFVPSAASADTILATSDVHGFNVVIRRQVDYVNKTIYTDFAVLQEGQVWQVFNHNDSAQAGWIVTDGSYVASVYGALHEAWEVSCLDDWSRGYRVFLFGIDVPSWICDHETTWEDAQSYVIPTKPVTPSTQTAKSSTFTNVDESDKIFASCTLTGPGGAIMPGTWVRQGTALIVREVYWDTNPVVAKVFVVESLDAHLFIGSSFDGNSKHERAGWWQDCAGGKAWSWMKVDACGEAVELARGALNVKDVTVLVNNVNWKTYCLDP